MRFSAFATCIIEQPSDNADLLGKTGRFPKNLKLCLDVGENKFTHQWRKPLETSYNTYLEVYEEEKCTNMKSMNNGQIEISKAFCILQEINRFGDRQPQDYYIFYENT